MEEITLQLNNVCSCSHYPDDCHISNRNTSLITM